MPGLCLLLHSRPALYACVVRQELLNAAVCSQRLR